MSSQSIANSFTYPSFYYKGLNANGSCQAWQDFTSSTLSLPFESVKFSVFNAVFETINYQTGEQDYANATCNEPTLVNNILSSLKSGVSFESICGAYSWRVFTCKTNRVLCINCRENCVDTVACPGTSLTINPCNPACQTRSAASVVLNAKFYFEILYPKFINSLNVSVLGKKSLSIVANITKPGNLYCAAFTQSQGPLSIIDIKTKGISIVVLVSLPVEVILTGLTSDTIYSIYCYTEDFKSNVMDFATALNTLTIAKTTCCKHFWSWKRKNCIC